MAKKCMISQPMNGLTDNDITEVRNRALEEIKKLGYDPDNPFFNYPAEVINNSSYNTYYCDGYYYAGGNYPVRSSVSYSSASAGLWSCVTNAAWSDALRVRLVYEPVA